MKRLLILLASCVVLWPVTTPAAAQQEATAQQETAQHETAQKDAAQDAALPAGEGRDLVTTTCSLCHLIGAVTRHHESEARWKEYVDDMIVRGAPLAPAEAKTVVQYLTKTFPPSPATASTSTKLAEGDGKDLVEAKCSVCHDVERVTKVYRDEQGWVSLVDSMVSRGAVISPDEVQKIRAYLFAHYGIQ
jgi:cytochrome c5